MKGNIQEIQHIAKLAKLKFSDEEAGVFAKEFHSILSHFANIDQEDFTDIDITEKTHASSVFRRDEVKVFEGKKELFQNAKSKREGYLTLPKILE